ncbi:hypothetical protein [Rhizobacter sp. OV335]|uniref:hypothetical protein n=1 Tax=Rhizobacter sp. OV335 TaxID=1500264 RepID=UPI00091A8DFA|nr:hypothetical protein [Rhizobacter sp. OV335]SHM25825.1 hypothetical protein SAMN02787076_00870 [Rhizobacter sp. OV335]
MSENTITTFTDGNRAIVDAAVEDINTATTSLSAGDVGPSGMFLLMAATSKFTMIVEASSSIQKSFGEACVSPARKIA